MGKSEEFDQQEITRVWPEEREAMMVQAVPEEVGGPKLVPVLEDPPLLAPVNYLEQDQPLGHGGAQTPAHGTRASSTGIWLCG
ncbi:hypothetical protein llap_18254 [Limosa lapponica baueri]|uniref:Uncharacterized protein n=1 Tax=Limosa lapponica baueri TaxID=1758121 RepID=A0A2I0TCB6_LIMLA|nr:hypothetical protein llap_18254 [Limosa lapponica baueri]